MKLGIVIAKGISEGRVSHFPIVFTQKLWNLKVENCSFFLIFKVLNKLVMKYKWNKNLKNCDKPFVILISPPHIRIFYVPQSINCG